MNGRRVWGDGKEGSEHVIHFLSDSKSRIGLILITILCISADNLYAQFDPLFSQNMFNLLSGNPGYAGSQKQMNVQVINRNQWTGLDGAPVTTVAGADVPLDIFEKKGGVGFEVMSDKAGLFSNWMIRASFARQLILSDGTLGVGISTAIISQSFDGSGVTLPESDYHNENDPLVPATEVAGYTPDFGVGAFYQGKKWYGGISIQHLFAPKPNFQEDFYVYIHRSMFLAGGYSFDADERRYTLKPSFFGRLGGGSWQIDWNLNIEFGDKYWGGISYRYQDAIVLLGGLRFENGMWAGYSYDITTSQLGSAGSNGSHEIVVGYSFDLKINKKNKRYKSVRFL
ncbi:PorP/SprF family type IX secretion system membrane protein [Thermophagus sp. OGC60D27]|uniref:PorP/SprF family type IX secretion system membrane protein n=1 Tax=Thermophagus sp. OGC60D27 TaxID=3458415 RepID=UPI0040384923